MFFSRSLMSVDDFFLLRFPREFLFFSSLAPPVFFKFSVAFHYSEEEAGDESEEYLSEIKKERISGG
jgi:hypothetical protein